MRLIDADALIEDIDGDLTDSIAEGRAIEKIMNAPTIEPEYEELDFVQPHEKISVNLQPERTGKWMPDNTDYLRQRFVCNACGISQKVETVMYKPIWEFCPRCGARMEK